MSDTEAARDPVEELAEEFLERWRQGEHPALTEYTIRHPEHADAIRELFPALVTLEQLKPVAGDLSGGAPPPARPTEGRPLERLGDFRILREAGRGGMGIVYEAEQVSLGRHVALKVLPAHALLDPRQLLRFEREARAAARLHHTNIVPVYGVGYHDGLHYYVMQYIQGHGLDVVLSELRRLRRPRNGKAPATDGTFRVRQRAAGDGSALAVAESLLSGKALPRSGERTPRAPLATTDGPTNSSPAASRSEATIHLPGQSDPSALSESGRAYWQSVARIGIQVAEALAYADSQGVRHRDIKPSNLLLDTQGTVWVTDFGLAKADGDPADLTHTGDIVGTLRYLAPEQFGGTGDLRSDIYSLGLTLYELLTLRPAFSEVNRSKLIKQLLHDEPARPRQLNPAVPRDLETVVLKAIAREPARRYQTPAELAEDLKRFVDDKPVRARRISNPEHVWRWCRRNPLNAGLLAALVLVGLASFALVTLFAIRAEAERDRAQGNYFEAEQLRAQTDESRQSALAALEEAETNVYYSRIAQAALHYRVNNLAKVQQSLDLCVPGPDRQDRRGWEWRYLHGLAHADLFTFAGHQVAGRNSWVSTLAFSPDGRRLAVGTETPLYVWVRPGMRCDLKVWDLDRGAPVLYLKDKLLSIRAIGFSADGARVGVASWDRVANRAATVTTWEVATGKAELALPEYRNVENSAMFKAVGRDVVVADPWTGVERLTLKDAGPGMQLVSPDGQNVTTVTNEGVVTAWDLRTGEQLRQARIASYSQTDRVVLHPDGRRLAFTHWGSRVIEIWDTVPVKQRQVIRSPGEVYSLAFSPDGRYLAYGSNDATIRLLDAGTAEEQFVLRGHEDPVHSLAFSPRGERLASGDWSGTVKLWDLTRQPEHLAVGRPGYTNALGFRSDNGRVALLSWTEGHLATWSPETGVLVGPCSPGGARGNAFIPNRQTVLSGDGQCLAAVSGEDPTRFELWDTRTGEEVPGPDHRRRPIQALALSRTGGRVAAAAWDPNPQPEQEPVEVMGWDADAGRELFSRSEPGLQPTGLALDPAGSLLAVAGLRYHKAQARLTSTVSLEVWDAGSGQRRFTLDGHEAPVDALRFSPDGGRLASADRAGRVRAWDMATGRLVRAWDGPPSLGDLAFSPDGRRLAGVTHTQVTLWDFASGHEVLTLELPRSAVGSAFNSRVAFSDDGQYLAANHSDGRIIRWSASEATAAARAARRQVAELRANSGAYLCERGRAFAEQGQWDRADADFARALAQEPDNAYIPFECLGVSARHGRWEKVPAYYARWYALRSHDAQEWRQTACLPLFFGDVPGYRSHCREMFERFGRSTDPEIVERLLSFGWLAGEWGGDPERLVELADRGLQRAGIKGNLIWPPLNKGMAEYRAGHFAQAVDWLRKANPPATEGHIRAVVQFFLSMAYSRLDRPDEARAAYADGCRLVNDYFNGPLTRNSWTSWPWCQVLRREAELLVPPPTETSVDR